MHCKRQDKNFQISQILRNDFIFHWIPVDHHKCCQRRWTFSVINWRRSSVASLSHWTSTFVCNTMGDRQRVARVCLRPLKLVEWAAVVGPSCQCLSTPLLWTLPTFDVQVGRAGNLTESIGSGDVDRSDVFWTDVDQPQDVRLLVNVVCDDAAVTGR